MGTGPVRLLIAAMGGEGGGVLAGWLTQAALSEGYWVQRTSVPGVAQRTGATTYYLEIVPRRGVQPPIMGLTPSPGRVDILLATELLEAARMVRAGFVTPNRTTLISSTHRVFSVAEKMAMADGRLDASELETLCRKQARRTLLADLSVVAAERLCHLNAVILGVLAGAQVLPLPVAALRGSASTGKGAEANLRGFDAGFALAQDPPRPQVTRVAPKVPATEDATSLLPAEAQALAQEGVRRLTDYQDAAYADLYIDRLHSVSSVPGVTPALLSAVARNLALRMSYEDTFRVAQLKLRASRLDKVKADARASEDDIVDVTEFMKPGPEEIFGMFPARLGHRLMAMVERRGWDKCALPMKIRTTRFSGYIRLRLLAAMRRRRLATLRHRQEDTWVERWLNLIRRACAVDPAAAAEIAECATLVRGYGDTYKRGLRNWHRIEEQVIVPCLEGAHPSRHFADAVLQARLAALADPDGVALSEMIAAFRKHERERMSA